MKNKFTIKVLVVDDHKLFRIGVVRLLRDRPNIFVVAEAENGKELLNKYFNAKPDVVLVDIAMPKMSGLEAVSLVREKDQKVKALFLSMYDGDEYVYQVLKSGGMGLVNKNILEGELAYAIEQVYIGEKYFGSKWTEEKLQRLIKEYESNKITKTDCEKLTYREEEVLKYINKGYTSVEIANKLKISKKTVDFYRSNIMRKFDLNGPNDLIIFAVNYFNS